MITSFEVGAVFKIINEASPQLTRMLRQVRELTAAVDKARASLAEITKGVGSGSGLAVAIGETKKLADTWGDVAAQAGAAQHSHDERRWRNRARGTSAASWWRRS